MIKEILNKLLNVLAGLFKVGLRQSRVSTKFEVRYKSLKKQIQSYSFRPHFDDWIP